MGEAVRAARRDQHLRQDEVALAAGVSTRTVHNIEHGLPGVRLDIAQRVLSVLGLTLEVARRPPRRTLPEQQREWE